VGSDAPQGMSRFQIPRKTAEIQVTAKNSYTGIAAANESSFAMAA
jgi:hypothetical protein